MEGERALDLDTSGVLVFARRHKAESELHCQFQERLVEKRYVARVLGQPVNDDGYIDLALSLERGVPRSRVDPAGRPAQTAWRVLHAASLTFAHPFSGERMTIEAPAPFR